MQLADLRIRTRIPPAELEAKQGRNLAAEDYNLLLTGPAYVRMPDNRPLCIYLPGVMAKHTTDQPTYDILCDIGKSSVTNNRGLAGATLRLPRGTQKRGYAVAVRSSIVGAIDPGGIYKYCRTTAWTGEHLPQWQALQPMLQDVARHLRDHVPDRYAAQQAIAQATKPEWVVPGTPFSTITVNDTYPTGVHTDKGDLDAGFSTLTCARRGSFTGGYLTFPEYRVAVNMQDGDLLLMDAHQWHGNTPIICACGSDLRKPCPGCGSQRISVVAYYRTKLQNCDTTEAELEKARSKRELKV